MPQPIVLIGPPASGKSTLAARLAADLGRRHVPLDAVRYYYFLCQSGYSLAEQMAQPDFAAVVAYWKPFEIEAAERVVAEFPDAVIDFGAGQAHYTDPQRIARLQAVLGPLPDVVLLLPSEDLDRAEQISIERDRERLGPQYEPTRADLVSAFVRSECFRTVAKRTVITGDGRTVDDSYAILRSGLVG